MAIEPKARFIVAPRGPTATGALQQLQAAVEQQGRAAASVEEVVGDPQHPARLVITATQGAARALKDRFGGELVIEPDSTLQMT